MERRAEESRNGASEGTGIQHNKWFESWAHQLRVSACECKGNSGEAAANPAWPDQCWSSANLLTESDIRGPSGLCGVSTPLGSTAGCGKPHVRWCGRVNGPYLPFTRPDQGCPPYFGVDGEHRLLRDTYLGRFHTIEGVFRAWVWIVRHHATLCG
jgi:hypothetical protein